MEHQIIQRCTGHPALHRSSVAQVIQRCTGPAPALHRSSVAQIQQGVRHLLWQVAVSIRILAGKRRHGRLADMVGAGLV